MDNSDSKKLDQYTVAIIGSGNVASHLVKAFSGKINVVQINPHTLENLPEATDIALISVKDSAIESVAQHINHRAKVIAHTSGSVPLSSLERNAQMTGVFYPLQTFTKNVHLNYKEIPFFIEGNTPETESLLSDLAHLISSEIHHADSEDRKRLHLASVFACNFTNCLIGASQKILEESGIDFRVMLPLLRQTLNKLNTLSPAQAQTGPAVRKDYPVMDAHMKMLEKNPMLQTIYKDISSQIINNTTI